MAIGTDTVNVISSNLLPMVEEKVGAGVVRWFLEILVFDPKGFERKEVITIVSHALQYTHLTLFLHILVYVIRDKISNVCLPFIFAL